MPLVEPVNLLYLQRLALAYCHETPDSNHFGPNVTRWLNEGVRKLWQKAGGVQDITIFKTVAGLRQYPAPTGFMYPIYLTLDGDQLRYETALRSLDFSSTGNSRPAYYTVFGKPFPQIYFGPAPPDSAYTVNLFHFRTPRTMTNTADVPELPPQWATAPVHFAAAHMALADNNAQQAQMLMGEFAAEAAEMQEFVQNESRDAFSTVQCEMDY